MVGNTCADASACGVAGILAVGGDLQATGSDLPLHTTVCAQIDCTAEMELCRQAFIQGFPSIRVFRKGHDDITVGGVRITWMEQVNRATGCGDAVCIMGQRSVLGSVHVLLDASVLLQPVLLWVVGWMLEQYNRLHGAYTLSLLLCFV